MRKLFLSVPFISQGKWINQRARGKFSRANLTTSCSDLHVEIISAALILMTHFNDETASL